MQKMQTASAHNYIVLGQRKAENDTTFDNNVKWTRQITAKKEGSGVKCLPVQRSAHSYAAQEGEPHAAAHTQWIRQHFAHIYYGHRQHSKQQSTNSSSRTVTLHRLILIRSRVSIGLAIERSVRQQQDTTSYVPYKANSKVAPNVEGLYVLFQ